MNTEWHGDELAGTEPEHAVAVTTPINVSPQSFAVALAEQSQKRAELEDYIRGHLKDGTDYGTIPGCGSKRSLFKPGSEKVAAVLRLRPTFRRDDDVLAMLSQSERDEGTVVFVCELVTSTGELAGEGRGSCGAERRDPNARIKMALKRAQVDAVLRVAALSDQFTQDVEDMHPSDLAGASRHAPQNRTGISQPNWLPDGCFVMRAKRAGRCAISGDAIEPGEPMVWSQGKGVAYTVDALHNAALADQPGEDRDE